MSDLNLYAIEARAAAATDGPWVVKHEPAWEADNVQHPDVITVGAQMWEGDDEPMTVCLVSTDYEDDPVDVLLDAEFIAHARTDVPALVAALREARADRDTAVLAAVRAEADRDEARAEVAAIRDRADRLEEEGFMVGGVWGDYGEVVVPSHAVEWVVSGLDEAVTPETDPDMAATWRDRVAATESERDDWRRRYEALRDGVTRLCDRYEHAEQWENPPSGQTVAAKFHNLVARVEGDES